MRRALTGLCIVTAVALGACGGGTRQIPLARATGTTATTAPTVAPSTAPSSALPTATTAAPKATPTTTRRRTSTPTTVSAAADAARAKGAVLVAADFPPDWDDQPADQSDEPD